MLVLLAAWLHAEGTDCVVTPDLLENCDQWTHCVANRGLGCYHPHVEYTPTLDLSYLKIIGTIPANVGEMVSLQRLILNGNQISGTLPKTLNDVENATSMYVSDPS